MYVCPHCQQSIGGISEKCYACGSVFEPSQWPEEAYSVNGMISQIKVMWAHNKWEPTTSDFIVGREPGTSGLELSGRLVSRQHARIYLQDGEWHIQRLDNAVTINSVNVEQAILHSGDQLQIGPYLLMISISYTQALVTAKYNGRLCSAETETLDCDRIYIGSDPGRCRVIIDGADKVHALIYYKKEDDAWWLVDNASSSGVKVNNKRIKNKKLYPCDEISIAGLELLFRDNQLSFGQTNQNNLSLSFINASATADNGFEILSNLNFHIKPGEFVGVLGPSGCGKSSVIQRIVGLAKFSDGEYLINGEQHNQIPDAFLDATAYLPQQNSLHDDLTLYQEFSCFRSLHTQKNFPITREAVRQALRLVGLENEIGKKNSQLSGGQQRRAGIALALLRSPQLLVLDEPTSGLDPATETEVMTYLRRISNQNKTVICSTHIMGNIDLFDKILVLSRGRLVFWGTPGELLEYFRIETPLSLYKLFASGNFEEQVETANEFSKRYYYSTLFQKYNTTKSEYQTLPPPHNPSVLKQIWGYWKRMFFELLSFKNSGAWWKTFWSSSCFIQLLIQPLLVALVLKMACAYNLLSDDGRKEVLFFASVAVFWLGLNNAVRELVKERVPWRCLERLERISTAVYLFSKVSFVTMLSLIQVIIFSIFLFEIKGFSIISNFPVVKPPTENPTAIPLLGGIVLVLFLVCTMGAWIGLSVSAIFKKENAAVGLLPIILIPVLFFSQPIIRNDNYSDITKPGKGNYTKIAVAIENVMPCHAPEILMDLQNGEAHRAISSPESAEEEHNKTLAAWNPMLRNTILYMILALGLMTCFQIKNENQWNGR